MAGGEVATMIVGSLSALALSTAIGAGLGSLLRSASLGVVGWVVLTVGVNLLGTMTAFSVVPGLQGLLPWMVFTRLMGGDFLDPAQPLSRLPVVYAVAAVWAAFVVPAFLRARRVPP